MIRRLQRRFVLIAALSLLLVELLIIGMINAAYIGQIDDREKQLMTILLDNDGEFPEFGIRKDKISPKPDDRFGKEDIMDEPPLMPDYVEEKQSHFGFRVNEETRYQTRYFYVRCSGDMKPVAINTAHVAAISSDEALDYAEKANDTGRNSGYLDNYLFSLKKTNDGGLLYVFLDCRDDIQNKHSFMLLSAGISFGGWVLVCVLIMVFSRFAVKPFAESYEKQRMFITDAEHEIKTPLAIISANTEVIEMIGEPNEWTESIKNQIGRMNGLVADLLKLSKMDEGSVGLTFAEFDLSEAFTDIAEPFRTLAENKGLSFELECTEGIRMNGDEASLRQLVSIFTENAVKYCDQDGSIKVSLARSSSGRHVLIQAENDCKTPPEHPERLFDRFYRADKSRKRDSGETDTGYGIGLAVAKAAAEAHKGKIGCKTAEGRIIFYARFRL